MLCQRDSSLMRSLAVAALRVTTARAVSCLRVPCLCFFSRFAKWAIIPFLAVRLVATGGAIWPRPLLLCRWVRICSLHREQENTFLFSLLSVLAGRRGWGSGTVVGGGAVRGLVGQCLTRGAGSLRENMALLFTGRFPEKLSLFPTCPALPSPAPLSPRARSREAMMNFPGTALQTVINNALLFGDGTFH